MRLRVSPIHLADSKRLFSTQQVSCVEKSALAPPKQLSGWSLWCGAGTGTCAVMAAMWAKGELEIGEDFVHESIVGTTFTGRLHGETTVGGEPAVVPTIAGQVRAREPGGGLWWGSRVCLCVCEHRSRSHAPCKASFSPGSRGPFGSVFSCRVLSVSVAAASQAWVTPHCTVVVDPTDPFPTGYTVGDIWCE